MFIPVSYTHLDVYKRQPFMPSTCQKIFSQLGISKNIEEISIEEDGVWGKFEGGTKTGTREILFPRINENQ